MCIGVCCLLSGLITHNLVIFSSFMFFCVAITLDNKKIVNIIFKTLLILLIIHIGLFMIDYLKGSIHVISDGQGRFRYNLGFKHPNMASFYILWCYFSYCYAKVNSFSKSIVAWILVLVCYYFTRTNTLLIISGLLPLYYLFSSFEIVDKVLSILCKFLFPATSIILIILCNMYDNNMKIAYEIDNILNYRIYYTAVAQKNYGYTLIGHKVNENIELSRDNIYMSKNIVLDIAHAGLLFKYGSIFILLISIVCYYIGNHSNNQYKLYLTLWIIYSMSEMAAITIIICFPLIFGSDYFKNRRKINNV